ncbi:sigma factor-like helix-turn-helix DNA-binding protein [Streptomyces sp. NPDC102359]|uniref:sigma factor-like helix-turn-helix DNA-binding protein n=1 Tax=unclassified Streptomyces TaxID=2593676 RepID=UPI003820F94D
MRPRHALDDVRAQEFRAYVAGAGGRLLQTATLLTAEPPDANPRARRLLTLALARTYAGWDGLHGEDPYDHTRRYLVTRFALSAWHRHGALRPRPRPGGPLAVLTPQERLVLVLRLHEGIAEEQTAAMLGLPLDRVRAAHDRAMAAVLRPPARPAPAPVRVDTVPS